MAGEAQSPRWVLDAAMEIDRWYESGNWCLFKDTPELWVAAIITKHMPADPASSGEREGD